MKTLNKLIYIIPRAKRKKLFLLIILLIIAMFLEILGLGLIVPILGSILDENKSKFVFEIINSFFQINDNNSLIFLSLFILFCVFFFKTIFITYLNYKQGKFLNNIRIYLTNELFVRYMTQPYDFFLQTNASLLIKNLNKEVMIVYGLSMKFISIIVESAMIVATVGTLIYIDPIGALSIGLFLFITAYLFYFFYKKKIMFYGEQRKKFDAESSLLYFETFIGIKDVKSFSKEEIIIDNHEDIVYAQGKLTVFIDFIMQLPRYFLELISIAGVFIFIFIKIIQGADLNGLIISVGVFVAATFKILPSINKLLSVSQNINYELPSLDLIFNELNNLEKQTQNPKILSNFHKLIEFKNISFHFEKSKKKILNNVSFSIKKGETIGLMGQSGAGKSTLVDLLLGLLKPTSGAIYFDGEKYDSKTMKNTFIGYVPQSINLLDRSIKNNILFFQDNFDQTLFENSIISADLKEMIENLPEKELTFVGDRGVRISGGQKQRIGIARALYTRPKILIFDEGTSALDDKTEKEVMNAIYNLKGELTIIIISHRMSTLNKCDRIYKLENGIVK